MNAKSIFLVILAVVSLALAGWFLFRPREKAVTVPAGARAGEIFLEPCTVKIGGTRYAADCGTLVVPENRSNPDSRLIALPVKRIHSPDSRPLEPIFYLAGGPGQSDQARQFFVELGGVVPAAGILVVGCE